MYLHVEVTQVLSIQWKEINVVYVFVVYPMMHVVHPLISLLRSVVLLYYSTCLFEACNFFEEPKEEKLSKRAA